LLDHIAFAYPVNANDPASAEEGPRTILKNINLEIEPGQVVAVVGHTGAGKSTIVQLLPRLYDPTAGKILIDGHDIREFKLDSLRAQMSMVLQETILFSGSVEGLRQADTPTGHMFSARAKEKFIRRKPSGHIEVRDACLHNLEHVSVRVPTGVLVAVTGVAGSGKSTLINDVFVSQHPEAVVVDQSPIGRSSRSNPATYVGAFDDIRKAFAAENGVEPGLFSFNSAGACPKCGGLGYVEVEMHFLDSVRMTCPECKGKRYTPAVLEMKYKGKSIADVLETTVTDSQGLFDGKKIRGKLAMLEKVGLGYLTLGQPLSTLSGGEAQRIKLATELDLNGNVYVMDEPTTGLHMADVERLMGICRSLVDAGNTVIVIEHNLDVIKRADWVIDMGPEGGKKGGRIIAEGTPEDVAKVESSYTGAFLKDLLIT
jgi:excinuclease UvrABC ATPase subunit